MTALDLGNTYGPHDPISDQTDTDWSPNLLVEYAMVAVGVALLLFAIIYGIVASR